MKAGKLEGAHELTGRLDKDRVRTFLQHAEEIFDTAREAGGEPCELAILVGADRRHPDAAGAWMGTGAAAVAPRGQGSLPGLAQLRRGFVWRPVVTGKTCMLQSRPRGVVFASPCPIILNI